MTKICSQCKIERPTTDFYKAKKSKDGLRSNCRFCCTAYTMQYQKTERGKAVLRKYFQSEKGKKTTQKYQHSEKGKEYQKEYNHSEAGKESNRKRQARYRDNNIKAKIIRSQRDRICKFLRGKNKSAPTMELLGCSSESLWLYLESLFQSGMTRENYGRGKGKWNVDHIIPCASFDQSDPKWQRVCFHYTNLQPMWSLDNVRKGARYVG